MASYLGSAREKRKGFEGAKTTPRVVTAQAGTHSQQRSM
jgi:hypothetical protein